MGEDEVNTRIVRRMVDKIKSYLSKNDHYCVEDVHASRASLWSDSYCEFREQPAMVVVYKPEMYACDAYITADAIAQCEFDVARILDEVEV